MKAFEKLNIAVAGTGSDLFIPALVNKIIRVSLYTKFRQMTKYVAISLVAILLAACNSSKNPHSSSGQEEDLSAKELLQGIWLDDETESPLMRIEGDTIYYADSQLITPKKKFDNFKTNYI